MSSYISESLRGRIAESDRHRCCYCLTSEINSGIRMTYDHIYPLSKGGETSGALAFGAQVRLKSINICVRMLCPGPTFNFLLQQLNSIR